MLWKSYTSQVVAASDFPEVVNIQNYGFDGRIDKLVAPLRIGKGPHLLIDDHLIDSEGGRERAFGQPTRIPHRPEKLPEPILRKEGWHEQAMFHLKVIHDPQMDCFRMWYIASVNRAKNWCYAYAESGDGLNWVRPSLGRIEVNGSTANNILHRGAYCLVFADHGPGWERPEERFVLLYLTGGLSISALHSRDGIHFLEHPANPVYPPGDQRLGDRLGGCWDSLRKCYLITIGYNGIPEDGYRGKPPHNKEDHRRLVGQMTTKDLENWTDFRRIVVADPEEPGMWEFYGMKPTVRAGQYLGFLRVLRDDLPADEDGEVAGIGWTELCTSQDGEHWTRHRDLFLDRNHGGGTWDHAMAWVGDCITVGDREFIYYGGYSSGHKIGDRQIGVATLRKDGFVSRDAGPEGACLRTRPFVFEGRELRVNADISGELRVRVVGASGLPLDGFFWRDCAPVTGDSIAHRVRWKEADLASLNGAPIVLEFHLRSAALYAFESA